MRARLTAESPIRLDHIRHPYGPCPAALDAAETPISVPVDMLTERLRRKLSQVYRLPADAVVVYDTVDNAIHTIVETTRGTLVGFPPSAVSSRLKRTWPEREHTQLARSAGRLGSLAPDLAADLPVDGVAIVDSPSDPLGMLLRPVDAVRVARACQLLIVDERYVEYAGQSLLSFAAEFDNIVVCRSFDAWAGLLDAPCGWAVVPRGLNERLGAALALPRPEAIVAALATLDWMTSVDMTMRLVRDERSRLYRLLRKFSLLEPLPSWGPFLTARVAIGSRDDVVKGLDRRGIVVHAPEEAGLENYIRFGIGTRTSMERLRGALLDLAPEILADSLEARRADSDGLALSGEELIQSEAGEVE